MKILHIGKEESRVRNTPVTDFTRSAEIRSLPVGKTAEEYAAAMPDAEVVIADAIADVPGELIRRLPRLKMIHSEGVAFNRIDLQAADLQGVYVCNCAGMNASAVAEQAVLLMQGMLKNVIANDRAVREGRQIQVKEDYMAKGTLRELSDCKVGLVGLGNIGKATAALLSAYQAEVFYYKRQRLSEAEEARYHVQYLPLDELLEKSDIVSLHLPVTAETEGMCGKSFFAKMKQGACFVNTSRGELVDDAALAEALESGRLAMAGLDTLDHEPVQPDHILLRQPPETGEKILFSPHIGGITASSFRRGYAMIWEDIRSLAEGRKPERVVNHPKVS